MRHIFAVALLVVSVMTLTPTLAHSDGMGSIQGVGLAYVDPFPKEAESYYAEVLSLKCLPGDAPDGLVLTAVGVTSYIMANLRLDLLRNTSTGDYGGGLSLPMEADIGLPVKLGLNHTDQGYGWHFRADVWAPASDTTENSALTNMMAANYINDSATRVSIVVTDDAYGLYCNVGLH